MKRLPLYMLSFGCGVMFMATIGATAERDRVRKLVAVECSPVPEVDEDSVREQAAVCRDVCNENRVNRIAKFKPGPWAHQMVCECKP